MTTARKTQKRGLFLQDSGRKGEGQPHNAASVVKQGIVVNPTSVSVRGCNAIIWKRCEVSENVSVPFIFGFF